MDEFLKRVGEIVPTLNGWCIAEKAQWLAKWIVEHRCVSVLEIGVFGGRSFVPMGLAMLEIGKTFPDWPGQVIGVDSYSNDDCVEGEESEAGKGYWRGLNLSEVRKNAEDAVAHFGLTKICKFWIMKGIDAVKHVDDGTLDLIHIDGSHSQEESTRDVKLWWPKLRPEGCMVMDDTNWPTVQAARSLAASLGKQVHHHEQWEAYQKART